MPVLAALLAVLLTASCGPRAERPNVVVIFLDQMAAYALGSYGNSLAATPHMDRLAEAGVRFELGITNHPLCTPARAALLSGQYSRTALGAAGNEPADESSLRERPTTFRPIASKAATCHANRRSTLNPSADPRQAESEMG